MDSADSFGLERDNIESVDQQLMDIIINSVDPPLPNAWRDDPLFQQCLSELSACSLTRLHNEPTHLRETLQRVQHENQELAVTHYDTFILTAQCSHSVLEQFHSVQSAVQHVKDVDMPALENTCKQFLQRGQTIMAAQKRNQMTLQKHNQILEILELPQLMDTCVRGGYYDEALELVAYIRRLQRRQFTHVHGQDKLSILPRLAKEVHRYTEILLCQLIQQLLGPLQLPACLKVVGYLRRMEVFNEAELRLLFLQCRDTWLRGLLKAVPKEDPAAHATKVMEQARIHLFDIVTQFRAVFSDDESPFSGSNLSSGIRRSYSIVTGTGHISTADPDPHYRNAVLNVTTAQQASLFHSWLVRRVTLLLNNILRKDVQRLLLAPDTSTFQTSTSKPSSQQQLSSSSTWGTTETSTASRAGALASLLAQAMYFGLSFGRIGCDFRPHVATLFCEALEAHYTSQLRFALGEFRDGLPLHSFASLSYLDSVSKKSSQQELKVSSSHNGSQNSGSTSEIVAPMDLLNFPLLAQLCNRFLSALNELRLCCPVNLIFKILESTQGALQDLANCLLTYHASSSDRFSPREMEGFSYLCEGFLLYLVPHLEQCLSHLLTLAINANSPSNIPTRMRATESVNNHSLHPLLTEGLKFWRLKNNLMPGISGPGRVAGRSSLQILENSGHRGGCIDWLTLSKMLLPLLPNEGRLHDLLTTYMASLESVNDDMTLSSVPTAQLTESDEANRVQEEILDSEDHIQVAGPLSTAEYSEHSSHSIHGGADSHVLNSVQITDLSNQFSDEFQSTNQVNDTTPPVQDNTDGCEDESDSLMKQSTL